MGSRIRNRQTGCRTPPVSYRTHRRLLARHRDRLACSVQWYDTGGDVRGEETMLCRSCGRMNRDDDLFCGTCGAKLLRFKACRACGAKNRHEATFCGTCGAQLPEGGMYCASCGDPLAPHAQFCANCGTQVVEGIVCAVCHEANRGDSRYCAVCGSALKIPATAAVPRPGSRD